MVPFSYSSFFFFFLFPLLFFLFILGAPREGGLDPLPPPLCFTPLVSLNLRAIKQCKICFLHLGYFLLDLLFCASMESRGRRAPLPPEVRMALPSFENKEMELFCYLGRGWHGYSAPSAPPKKILSFTHARFGLMGLKRKRTMYWSKIS